MYEQVVQPFAMVFKNPEASLIYENFISVSAILGIFVGYCILVALSIKIPKVREVILMTVDGQYIPKFIPYIIKIVYSMIENVSKYLYQVIIEVFSKITRQ